MKPKHEKAIAIAKKTKVTRAQSGECLGYRPSGADEILETGDVGFADAECEWTARVRGRSVDYTDQDYSLQHREFESETAAWSFAAQRAYDASEWADIYPLGGVPSVGTLLFGRRG